MRKSAKKYTVEDLQRLGYLGYQRNTMTGNTIIAQYPLRYAVHAANNHPNRLHFTRDLIGGKIRVHISGYYPTPFSTLEIFIERAMNEEELAEVRSELARMGVTVSFGSTSDYKTFDPRFTEVEQNITT